MTDVLKLKAALTAKGLTQGRVAKILGISTATFNYKVNNKSEFKATEIQKLNEIIKFDNLNTIFFA